MPFGLKQMPVATLPFQIVFNRPALTRDMGVGDHTIDGFLRGQLPVSTTPCFTTPKP